MSQTLLKFFNLIVGYANDGLSLTNIVEKLVDFAKTKEIEGEEVYDTFKAGLTIANLLLKFLRMVELYPKLTKAIVRDRAIWCCWYISTGCLTFFLFTRYITETGTTNS